jgi:hypothetical protein
MNLQRKNYTEYIKMQRTLYKTATTENAGIGLTGCPISAFLRYGSMNLNKSTSSLWNNGQPFCELHSSNFGMKLL